jgi:broad specificity phosphatase PhoE
MPLRLLLLSHAATAAMRRGAFPDDDPLDERGFAAAQAWRGHLPASPDAAIFSSPASCARETARALDLPARVAAELADIDHGRWRGQRLADIAADEAQALAAWLGDPDAAPHGGESFAAAASRVGAWLDGLDGALETVVAVTHAAIVRAAVIHALRAPPASFLHIEIAPLAVVELRRSDRGWVWLPTVSPAPIGS